MLINLIRLFCLFSTIIQSIAYFESKVQTEIEELFAKKEASLQTEGSHRRTIPNSYPANEENYSYEMSKFGRSALFAQDEGQSNQAENKEQANENENSNNDNQAENENQDENTVDGQGEDQDINIKLPVSLKGK